MSSEQESDSQYKVLIAHYSEDVGLYDTVSEVLETQTVDDNLKIKCKSVHDTVAGAPYSRSLSTEIEACHFILVLVTQEAMKKCEWLKYNFMKSLEESLKLQQLCVVLVLIQTEADDLQETWKGHIHDTMVMKVEDETQLKDQEFLTDVIKRIKEMKHMEPIQLELNLAVGQVWSHFNGYSQYVMPVLVDRIKSHELYSGNEDRFPLKEFNLIPKSAKGVKELLKEIHPDIVHEGRLDEIVGQRGSDPKRTYAPPVYSIKDKDSKKYYFVAHIPNTLSILSEEKLSQQKQTGKELKISPGERSLQVERFVIMFNHLLNHPLNELCNDKLELIKYDDTKLSVEEIKNLVLDRVKQACACSAENQLEKDLAKVDINAAKKSETNDPDPDGIANDKANTVYIGHVEEDAQSADDLKTYLQKQHIKVIDTNKPGRSEFRNLEEAVKLAQWIVFIFSKASLEKFEEFMYKCRMVLHQSIMDDEVRFIPLLNDKVTEEELPGDLRAVLTLHMSQPDYKKAIASIVKCRCIKMEAKVSVKGIHVGLAWAYDINFLETVKENFTDEDKKKLSEKYPGTTIHQRLFLLIPRTTTKPLKDLDKDENGRPLNEKNFKKLEEQEIKTVMKNGIERKYKVQPYMVTDREGQKHIVLAEYVNPVICLQEMMADDVRVLSSLNQELFEKEVDEFQKLLTKIINWQGLDKQFAVVYYDDKKRNVLEVLLELLKTKQNEA